MAQSKRQIQDFLSRAGCEPLHRFGQNFMIDQNIIRLIADAGQIDRNDLVLEIGPGTGTLTEELLERSDHLIAVEIDRKLSIHLREHFAARPNFSLIEGDALAGKHHLNPQVLEQIAAARGEGRSIKLIANLPYQIASPLVIELLLAGADQLTFTVQKEVGYRLKAAAGSDEYGPLSVMGQLLSRVEVLRTISPQAFWPAPKIESALVQMTRADRLGPAGNSFSTFVHSLFSYRRKTLRKAMIESGHDADRVLAATGFDPISRSESLTPEQLFDLYRASSPA